MLADPGDVATSSSRDAGRSIGQGTDAGQVRAELLALAGDLEAGGELRLGLAQASDTLVGDAEIVANVVSLGGPLRRFLQMGNRLVEAALPDPDQPETVVNIRVGRIQTEARLHLLDRLLGAAQVRQGAPLEVEGNGIMGRQRHGTPRRRQRLVEAASVVQHARQVHVGLDEVLLQLEGPL